MKKIIEFDHISKAYDNTAKVIDDLTLDIYQGELVTLLGPSGCGKTTLLKMVNKLILPSSGAVKVNGADINQLDTIELRRSIGYVIQHIGLMPHLTIRDNINYVLAITKTEADIKEERARELIRLVGLSEDYLDRYPRQLSGGQKQRVGVARALAADPKIILMDEPFGAVDEIARTVLQDELRSIHQQLQKTILFVTHDINEAIKLGTKIVLLHDGKIEQMGRAQELIFEPASDFVRDFFGTKGFKATLDETLINDLYDRLLRKEETIDSVYSKLNA